MGTCLNVRRALLALGALLLLPIASLQAQPAPFIVVASTTSTEQSGLFAYLLPAFRRDSGIEVRVVALGTGQAIDMARRGDADLLLVHDREAELKFVAEGHGLARSDVMYNDFVLVGPKADPARVAGADIVRALERLVASNASFVSRGDRSGTHAAELRYWKAAGIDSPAGRLAGYKSCGCGMGPALNMSASTGAYVLADRATWLSFRNPADLQILVQGDRRLFNQYGVVVVDPRRHPHVKEVQAKSFANWLIGPRGQAEIAAYRIGGQQLFFPNAER